MAPLAPEATFAGVVAEFNTTHANICSAEGCTVFELFKSCCAHLGSPLSQETVSKRATTDGLSAVARAKSEFAKKARVSGGSSSGSAISVSTAAASRSVATLDSILTS